MSVYEESEAAIEAARANGLLEASDDAAVAALLHIADQIDSQIDGLTPSGKLDNVSIPTFLKYCEALGLTPLARQKIQAAMLENRKAGDSTSGGKLGKLRAIHGGQAG